MSILVQKHDLEDYEEFINAELFAGRPLADFVAEVQRIYCTDKRPWVIGYSGGKDSTVIVTLVYLALLGLEPERRSKPVFIVSSDTLVETPVVVDMITRTLKMIEDGARRDELPITTHLVTPKTDATFWVSLLGKGYPAPTRQFRWCTERIKIDPVSLFIKEKVAQFDEVILLLGSRSDESASRAQVIARHKIDGSRLARHTTLPNAYIYTPIDTWNTNDVWSLLRGAYKYSDFVDEWESPWGTSNLPLWTLYLNSSNQGECPLVIDDSTPSCGNSRFGCWTCTVVTKDKAMEGLIKNGEEWMSPLLRYRDLLASTGDPSQKAKYRNFKRRDGRVIYQNAKEGEELDSQRKFIPGPYWLKFRKQWLEDLLTIEKQLNQEGHEITLITEPELHEIRQEWFKDPNEPDWEDSLPSIYRKVYGRDLEWSNNDRPRFDADDAKMLEQLGDEYDVAPAMIKKLIELELSMEGLSRRSGVFNKISSLLKQDWGSLEEIEAKKSQLQAKHEYDLHQKEIQDYEDKIREIEALLLRDKQAELI
ncbi:DNA phosphorothioation system sulfurtransferase DndC [Neptunomonas qingdaonensis]|uniref:DNA sulfur modification protein DndC n=1 Tax=Neptunomonas qingdaonensis TaxID=1045558 RepID=A0A1I2TWN9_9GAMM|nr:DNA phosphorothioation system sulfurtransferase DndC [Neptunomonas qingdaonensis]SFG68629.1 DNA sulfur modification protein DndC [Neptunomonas qingdaonensis]